jgi:hypothetical protein
VYQAEKMGDLAKTKDQLLLERGEELLRMKTERAGERTMWKPILSV